MTKDDFKFIEKNENLDIEETRVSLTYWQDVWRRLRKNKMSMLGLSIVVGIILFAIIGPWFTPFSFEDQELGLRNLPPKLEVYKIDDGVFVHRTEAYNVIEFDEDGNVVNLLSQTSYDEDNKIYNYSYVKEYDYDNALDGAYPLPATVSLSDTAFYSEIWGIALADRESASGDAEVFIEYVHPNSPFASGTLTSGSEMDSIVGLLVDQITMTDDISDPEIIDLFTVKSNRTAMFMIIDMDKKITGTTEYSKLNSIVLYETDLLTLDFSLKYLESSEKPAGYEDVDYIFTYKGVETTDVYDSFSNHTYPWGTDSLGRDELTRVMYGARISLLVAAIATLVNFVIGITYGSVSGYFGGRVDNIMMRIVDIINSIPLVLYVILLMVVLREYTIEATIFGKNVMLFNGSDGFTTIVIALGSIYWVGMARLVRGQVLGLKEQEYVLAARTIGVSNKKIILKHLIPNALGPIIVSLTMMIPSAVFTEAFLSFIGIGVSAPQASWGTLANEALGGISRYTYQLVYPSMAIAITMLGFNFLGDGLRDALDPRLRKG